MARMSRPRWQYFLLFLTYLSIALAASPTSFCKCTCGSNSTIIPLDSSTSSDTQPAPPNPDQPSSNNPSNPPLHLRADSNSPPPKSRTCADCTRTFCLSYNLPICKDVKEEEVFTTCFQRDSAKDEAVVWIFLVLTVGLLGWASVKPVVGKWRERREGVGAGGGGFGRGQGARQGYARVGGQGSGGGGGGG